MSPSEEEATEKKKALKATWDDLSTFEYEEPHNKEVANYALMALNNEVSNLIEAHLSFTELLNIFL